MKYLQTCQCKGRGISAGKDATRYDQEARDIDYEIVRLERERTVAFEKARRARIRALQELQGPRDPISHDRSPCSVCGGTGVVESKGQIAPIDTEWVLAVGRPFGK